MIFQWPDRLVFACGCGVYEPLPGLSYAAQLQVYLRHNSSNNNSCWWGGRGERGHDGYAAGVWRGTAATAVRSSRWSKLGSKSGEGVTVAAATVASAAAAAGIAAAAGVLRSGHVLRRLAC